MTISSRPHRISRRLLFAFLSAMAGSAVWAGTVPHVPLHAPSHVAATGGHVLVKFRAGAAAGQKALAAAGFSPQRNIDSLGVHVLAIPEGQTADDFISSLQARYGGDLAYAEPDHLRYATFTPNDPYFVDEYHLFKISAPTAWNTTTGSGVTIAIADTGVTTGHPDLATNLLAGHNVMDGSGDVTDVNGHGTAVAGTAAAVGNNSIGVVGVAFTASILPIKISSDGTSTDSYIADAIVYAADHGAKVVNVSFNSDGVGDCWSATVLSAADYMNSKGGLVVIAAGNADIDKGCPNNPEIIDVAATDENDQKASFSNYGAEIDIAAPGNNIDTTNCNACLPAAPSGFGGLGDYVSASGTSFASPITAGALGLIFAAAPTFTPGQAQQALFDSATDLGAPGYDTTFGWGRVNVQQALIVAQQRSVQAQLETLSNVYAYPNPWDTRKNTNRQVTIANVPDDATIKLFTLSGFWVRNLPPSNGRAVWDLTNSSGDRVASGLYFYLVTTPSAQTKGEIAIIK